VRGKEKQYNRLVSFFELNTIEKESIEVEEVESKNYENGKYYALNFRCSGGSNCIGQSYFDMELATPEENRSDIIVEISFNTKEEAEKYQALFKASIK
jgi:hypothetical protein